MVEKQKRPKLNLNLVVDNTLFNDVLDVKWYNTSLIEEWGWGGGIRLPPMNTSEFRLRVVKLDSTLVMPIFMYIYADLNKR